VAASTRTTCCCCEQGVETSTEWADEGLRRGDGTGWGSERDRHETKDDSACFKHPSRLSSHIAYKQAGGHLVPSKSRRSLDTIAPCRPVKVRWDEGCAIGERPRRQRLPNLPNVAPAGSLTSQTLALKLLPSTPPGHSLADNSKSAPQAIRWFLHW
jgi:hypothetical protein